MADNAGSSTSKRSANGAGTPTARKRAARAKAKKPAARAKKPAARATPKRSAAKSAAGSANGRGRAPATRDDGGIADTIKHAASRAKGPAVAVGAAAAGVAGGLVLRRRHRRTTVLGVPVPNHLPSVDPKAVAKTVGAASKRFAKTSKSVSKDIERAADQAERIGKILD